MAGLAVLLWLLSMGSGHASGIAPRRLLEVVDFGPPVVSPDGLRVAFRTEQPSIERNTWDSVWYVQSLREASAPLRVADGGVPLRNAAGLPQPASALWSPDGRWIYYLASLDGRVDVWRAATDGSGAEAVTGDAADVRKFVLAQEGRRLVYSVGATRAQVAQAEQDEYDRGIRIDARVPIGHNLFRSLDLGGRWATQRYEGMWFGLAPLLSDTPDRWRSLDVGGSNGSTDPAAADRPVPPLAPSDLAGVLAHPWKVAEEPGGRRVAALSRTGSAEGLREPLGVELSVLEDRTSGVPVRCASPLCVGRAISAMLWRPGSDDVLFTVTDPDAGLAQSIYRWDLATGDVHPVASANGLLNGGRDRFSSCGASHAFLVCVAAEADRPPRLERVDIGTGRRHVLFAPNAALDADMARTMRAEFLRWEDGSGQVFTGQLFAAPGSDRVPAPLFVTYYHCPGFLRGGVGDEWPLASLAGHGISALCVNAPPGYPRDAVVRFDRAASAVRGAVRLLADQGRVDPSKVGMGGLSFGTEATFWTLSQTDLLAAASVASVAIEPNYVLFNALRPDSFFEEMRASWGLGWPGETPERWRELAPIHHLDRISAPVLFQLSEQEYLYSLGVSLPLVRRRQGDLYVFPHEPHQKFQPKHKLAVYERNLDWFRFWLLGEEDSDPAKRTQFDHWRRMRDAQATRTAQDASGPLVPSPQPVFDHAQVENADERRVPRR